MPGPPAPGVRGAREIIPAGPRGRGPSPGSSAPARESLPCAAGKYGGRPSGCRDRVNPPVTADDWITRASPPPLLFHDVGDGPAVGSLDTDTRIEPVERHLKLQCSVILHGG